MSCFVKFWGTRGSIPTPGPASRKYGGNTSCVELRTDKALFVCDAGTGLRELGLDLVKRGPGLVGHMLISHAHWDHIQGFPFFVPAYDPKNTFHVYGTGAGDRRIFELLSGQMRSEYFPVNFSDLRSRILAADFGGGPKTIDGVEVSFHKQPHPGDSYGFSFIADGKKVVYATDSELDLVIENAEESKSNAAALRKIPKGLCDFVRDADLLISDSQYTDEEYPTKVGWGHPRATTAVDLAVQAGVRQLALYHHDPMHSDSELDRLIEVCQERAFKHGTKIGVFGAREGMELRVA